MDRLEVKTDGDLGSASLIEDVKVTDTILIYLARLTEVFNLLSTHGLQDSGFTR